MHPVSETGAAIAAPRGLKLKRLGIDTYQEAVIYMNRDCAVCRAEGFNAQSRVQVRLGDRHIIATLNVVSAAMLQEHEAGLSESAWRALHAQDGATIEVSHPEPLESLSALRAKVYGRRLEADAWRDIIADVAAGHYSNLHLAALVTACAGDRLDLAETIALTRAMVDSGERLTWPTRPVVDKHCVGGLPGNRTTPLVVAIVAAAGLTIPKTSSRAITSPAGTADTMEVLAPVDLSLEQMRRVVEREGGCIVWGGNVRMSPADDLLIRVERPLDFDSEGQLTASVLSKKIAAGSTHILIDLPVGPTAKVRSLAAAHALSERLEAVGEATNVHVEVHLSDGTQPVGRGIGPALEARDVLAVLRQEATAPRDLRERALTLAAQVLQFDPRIRAGSGAARATEILDSGLAWRKFQAICEAQGGLREPQRAPFTHVVTSARAGVCTAIDNRRIAQVAKLAGAPTGATAGVELHVRVGARAEKDAPLYTVHAESRGELDYALNFAARHPTLVRVEDQ
ncbi:MAG TPA: thymidine phosphorylase family protein [Steroidobacteraceae bacterium]|nr:thymidine phosphorylase family protein [Steroidobacteraceae bacterium]